MSGGEVVAWRVDAGQDAAMATFGFDSTTDDVLDGIDLTGVTVLITGTSAGLGVETARAAAAHGADVVGVVRDIDKAQANLEQAGATGVELHQADLASLASIRSFTDAFLADGRDRIDVLIANAGIMACPQGTTADGFELQFGTNHLGHFVLVNRLLPLLLTGPPARIVTLSSAGHRFGDVSLDDPGFEQTPYEAWVAYGRAKTANVLFAVELDRRLRDRGVRATAVHPGGIQTDLGRHLTDETLNALVEARGDRKLEWKTVPQGAATSIWAGFVADGDEVGGAYCEDCAVAPVIDDPVTSPGVMGYALDPDTAAALWTRSEELVGETFDP
jgi:NAD(P)-dependent dehydrogenase (short-subunit alcohol dehydrogenase family)